MKIVLILTIFRKILGISTKIQVMEAISVKMELTHDGKYTKQKIHQNKLRIVDPSLDHLMMKAPAIPVKNLQTFSMSWALSS